MTEGAAPAPTEYVYLIGSESSPLVKIGRTTDLLRRLADIQNMSPVKLAVLWKTKGGADLEAVLHRHFKDQRSHGEWFDFPDGDALRQVLQVITEITEERQRLHPSLVPNAEELRAVEEIIDPIERVREVGRILEQQREAAKRLVAIRRRAVAEARLGGMSLKDVADDLGVTPGRVSQLANDWTPERKRSRSRNTPTDDREPV